ncbi:kinase-like domain-containing protein [Dactylonectria macrodidyma]|uniref:Kinase-like domain-containing protein n=1 Tax=Dactylonectria macrodidyma TaxID=307937 RepID=A0A9P9EB60_9HYPO|nr:kinase-like domain-containing protein [Dactylonectria macrodidyma]
MILRRGKDYFLATADRGVPELKDLEIDTLDLTPIPPEHFRPKVKHGITQAPESLPDVYVKRPCLFDWDPSDTNPEHISDLVLQEAGICEILTKHPHPNIVRYFGCLVEDGRISGLCLAKYNSKLSEKLVNSSVAKREMYYEGIKKGIHHLHQLGFIHNDLNPSNIMMDGNTPVIIDFDSCRPNGEKLGAKAGTFKWELEEATFATPENDFYSLAKLRDFILKGNER